jgi:hypothetical protein
LALVNALSVIAFPNPSLTLLFVILTDFVDHPPDRGDRAGKDAIQDDASDDGNRKWCCYAVLRSVGYSPATIPIQPSWQAGEARSIEPTKRVLKAALLAPSLRG